MDIVYTLKQSAHNEELTYSLRSLVNLPHDRVFFIGGCPSNINRNKIHYLCTETLRSKYETTTNNLLWACRLNSLSDNFIWMNDDFFILQRIEDPVKELLLNRGTIESVLTEFQEQNGKLTSYMQGAKQTMQFLKNNGIEDPLSYELHTPFVYNKYNVISMLNLHGIFRIPVLHKRSVYGNMYIKHSDKCEDCKILRKSKVECKDLENQKFLSCSDETWPKIKEFLSNKFREKSEYEL